MVALMCLSWFAFLRVGEAASISVADIQGEKALGFLGYQEGGHWTTMAPVVRVVEGLGRYPRDYTKGWEGDARVWDAAF